MTFRDWLKGIFGPLKFFDFSFIKFNTRNSLQLILVQKVQVFMHRFRDEFDSYRLDKIASNCVILFLHCLYGIRVKCSTLKKKNVRLNICTIFLILEYCGLHKTNVSSRYLPAANFVWNISVKLMANNEITRWWYIDL